VSPAGEIYVGSFRDSGWGGGTNTGEVVRLGREGEMPFGIREVTARASGFLLAFTSACDRTEGGRPENYALSAHRRLWKGGYATADQDRHEVPVAAARVAGDGLAVELQAGPLRPGFLYELRARAAVAPGGAPFWPQVAYYTLHAVPAEEK
jgi:hypothetical protein